eukprot:scaffold268089_cov41-Attheya_sp.AAC.1
MKATSKHDPGLPTRTSLYLNLDLGWVASMRSSTLTFGFLVTAGCTAAMRTAFGVGFFQGSWPWLLRGVPAPPPKSCAAVPAPAGCTWPGRNGDGRENPRSLSVG